MNEIGKMNEVDNFLSGHPDVQAVDALISDLVGFPRGKRIDKSNLNKVYQSGVNMPATLFSMTVLGDVVEECGLGQKIGEPDLVCKPIANSLHLASWHDRPIAQLLMSMYYHDGKPFECDPRHVLAQLAEQLNSMGYYPVVAVELEFYLFDKKRDSKGQLKAPISPKTERREEHTQVYSVDTISDYSALLDDINKVCVEQNVPADTAVAESAPGQFEINLKHQANPLHACDNAILLKRIVKAIGEKHGFDVSFMAKPYAEEAGNGLHVHVSLLDEQGNNTFADDAKDHSETLEHAIGGMLEFMPASMPFLCPNVNSYRRFKPGYYVAMHKTWGLDNRTVALRIPKSDKTATRIEHRIAGADANPYLVMSVIFASIIHGIKHQIQPITKTLGNAFDFDNEELPIKLHSALKVARSDTELKQYLGEKFCHIYLTAKQKELDEFEAHITDLEVKWYLSNT